MNEVVAPMICFEYDSLYRANFVYAQDFDYLIEQDLPCFNIKLKRGEPILYVRHYLAIIGMPSGQTLEILPKIAVSNQNDSTQQIHQTCKWVQRMLETTINSTTAHTIDAVYFKHYQNDASNHSSDFEYLEDKQAPLFGAWYHWLYKQYMQQLQSISTITPRRYERRLHNASTPLGKINIKRQLRDNLHRPHYIACEQTYLADIKLLWQFLLTAYQQLSMDGYDINHFIHSKPPIKIAKRLQQHKPLPISQWQPSYHKLQQDSKLWQPQVSQHQMAQIKQAIAWAWWILRSFVQVESLEPDDMLLDTLNLSNIDSHVTHLNKQLITLPKHAFMLNMNHLFEQWVSIELKKWCTSTLPQSHYILQPSYDWLYLANTHLAYDVAEDPEQDLILQCLRPDICISDKDGNISHVIDIKYKVLHSLKHIHNSDLYQLTSYQQHLAAANAWLIYPQSAALKKAITLKSTKQAGLNIATTNLSIVPFCVDTSKIIE